MASTCPTISSLTHSPPSRDRQWRLDVSPELAVSLGLLHERRSTHALDPRSVESFEQRLEYVRKSLASVKELVEKEGGMDAIPSSTKLSVELYVDQLETYLENSKYQSHLSCVNRRDFDKNGVLRQT